VRAGYAAHELRFGNQKIENNPMQRKEPFEKKGVAGIDVTPQKRFDTSGKSAAHLHHRAICKTAAHGAAPHC
jgi:hypothetical protein